MKEFRSYIAIFLYAILFLFGCWGIYGILITDNMSIKLFFTEFIPALLIIIVSSLGIGTYLVVVDENLYLNTWGWLTCINMKEIVGITSVSFKILGFYFLHCENKRTYVIYFPFMSRKMKLLIRTIQMYNKDVYVA